MYLVLFLISLKILTINKYLPSYTEYMCIKYIRNHPYLMHMISLYMFAKNMKMYMTAIKNKHTLCTLNYTYGCQI